MEADIDEINICISRYFCNIIHRHLVGKTSQDKRGQSNQHLYYIDLIDAYTKKQSTDPRMLMTNLTEILKIHNKTTRNIISLEIMINTFVMNYTFLKVYEKITYSDKIEIINHIIYRTLQEYQMWICKKDNKAFYNVELTDEQKQKMINKLFKFIRENGVIERYKMYNVDNETVPRKLFLELKKQYDKLKRKLEQSDESSD